MAHAHRLVWLATALALAACDAPSPEDAGVADAAADAEPSAVCSDSSECDDGVFCNGVEVCDPTDTAADSAGCVAGADPCATSACDEGSDMCVACEVDADVDRDGFDSVACGGADCDDTDAMRFPGNPEICDAEDHDEDCDPSTFGVRDQDGDGEPDMLCCNEAADGSRACGTDCDDLRGSVSPRLAEVCDGLDNNCDGSVDEGVIATFYEDADGDGFGSMAAGAATVEACFAPAGFVASNTDCDDTSGAVNPGNAELCDSATPPLDEDCDGEANPATLCACDFVGERPCSEIGLMGPCGLATYTCVDGMAQDCSLQPTDEVCDGVDNDCDGSEDEPPEAACNLSGAFGLCLGGACRVLECRGGRGDCDGDVDNGCETDVRTDAAHCGGCGIACGTGGTCVDGQCDQVVDLSLGTRHACAVRESGQIVCWGVGGSGALGNMSAGDEGRPVRVLGSFDDATAVAAGENHTCGLHADGTISCWGAGTNGQHGDGETQERRLVPAARVGGATPLGDVVEIAAGRRHSCARVSNGDVYCWGSNDDGEAGAGLGVHPVLTPTRVAGISNAVQLALGQDHSCARISGGDVMCWGANSRGQIGDGSTSGPVESPTLVTGISAIESRDISAGRNHTCVRRANGRVACWGSNSSGQLGVDPSSVNERGTAANVPSFSSITRVMLGHTHSCARDEERRVWCWGSDDDGELGDGSAGPDVFVPQLMQLHAGVDLSDARSTVGDGGDGFHCVARATGQLVCVGQQGGGRLGNGPTSAEAVPLPSSVLDITAPTHIAAGEEHSCVRFDVGRMGCWGAHQSGQLGTGDDPVTVSGRPVVTGVATTRDAAQVRTGNEFSCASRANGQAVCWGENDFGQLGNDDAPNASERPRNVLGLADVVDVQTGSAFACALDRSGAVSCWGRGNRGQLGDGSSADSATPVRVQGLSSERPVQLSVGARHACVLTDDADVYCWGDNARGQLNTTLGDQPTAALSNTGGVLSIAAGGNHTCAIETSGVIRCWGGNQSGQLGRGTTSSTGAPMPISSAFTDWVAIEAAETHTCARRSNGEIWCWGEGSEGRLGNGASIQESSPVMTSLSPADAIALTSRRAHGCAMRADRSVVCWGRNDSGQLGDGAGPTDRDAPVEVLSLP